MLNFEIMGYSTRSCVTREGPWRQLDCVLDVQDDLQ